MPNRTLETLSLIATVLLGAVVALVGSFLQASMVLGLPVGLAVGLMLSVVTVLGSGLATGSRLGAGLAVAAWVVTVAWISLPRPEGDQVLPARWPSYVWMYGGTLALAACCLLDYRRLTASWALVPHGPALAGSTE